MSDDFEKLQEHLEDKGYPGQCQQYEYEPQNTACGGHAVPKSGDDMEALQLHLQQRDYDDELRRARAVADEQYKYWCEGDVEEERKRRLPPWFIWAVNSTNFAILIVLILILLRLK